MVGRRTSKIRVINLNVTEAIVVENLELGLIGFGNVCEVLLVGGIDVFWICSSFLVAHVIPFRCSQGQLAFVDPLLRHNALEVIPLIDVSTTNMFDLTGADDAFARLMAGLGECGYIRHVEAEDVEVGILDLLEAFHPGEEGTPEHLVELSESRKDIVGSNTDCGAYIPHLIWDGYPA